MVHCKPAFSTSGTHMVHFLPAFATSGTHMVHCRPAFDTSGTHMVHFYLLLPFPENTWLILDLVLALPVHK